MNRLQAGGLFLLSMTVLGCESGQTGSPSCAGPCQCTDLADAHVAKGTVTGVEAGIVTVHVDQILDDDPNSMAYLDQTVMGSPSLPGICAAQTPERPQVGDAVFVTFFDRYRDDDGGFERTLSTQPWADEIRLGDGSRVPLADAVELAKPGACNQRYATPCNDIINNDGSIVCSTSRPGNASWPSPVALLTALLLACALLRRRPRA